MAETTTCERPRRGRVRPTKDKGAARVDMEATTTPPRLPALRTETSARL